MASCKFGHPKLGKEAIADLRWWLAIFRNEKWSGMSIIRPDQWIDSLVLNIETDACLWGEGTFFNGAWYSRAWSPEILARARRSSAIDITFLELLAVCNALATHGHSWAGLQIRFHCDNKGVVDIWNNGSAHSPELRALIRDFKLMLQFFSVDIDIVHIPGKLNIRADLLSRNSIQEFLNAFPSCNLLPSIPRSWPIESQFDFYK